MRWNGWGDERRTFDFHGREDCVWSMFRESFGLGTLHESRPPSSATLPPSRLPQYDEAFPCALSRSHEDRRRHAAGRSLPDLLLLRSGQLQTAPDAVAFPTSHDECQSVLNFCQDKGVAVVPFGGGTSVVGGVSPLRGPHEAVVALSTRKMNRLLDVNPLARTARFETGVLGPNLEAKLRVRGFTLGHFPQSFEYSTLGGWIASAGAGQASNRYGTAADWFAGGRIASPSGTLDLPHFPHSAAGADLRKLVVGSEGRLGVLTEADIKIRECSPGQGYASFLFRDFSSGVAVVRRLAQEGVALSTVRLSDGPETAWFSKLQTALKGESNLQGLINPVLEKAGFGSGRCHLLLAFDGTSFELARILSECMRIAVTGGGVYIGSGPGESWNRNRYMLPFLRDPLLDRGLIVDTLETCTTWDKIEGTHARVHDAIHDALTQVTTHPVVLCHISHSYSDGASLYFTFVYPTHAKDPLEEWRGIKAAACAAIVASGATISHHHGVGTDHRDFLSAEKGDLGVRLLGSSFRDLDPKNIMNPGKLSQH